MYRNEEDKQSVLNAIQSIFDSQKELVNEFKDFYTDEYHDLLVDEINNEGYPSDVELERVAEHIKVSIKNVWSDGNWLDAVDVALPDTSNPEYIEEFINDDTSVINVILEHVEEGCEIYLDIPSVYDYMEAHPTVEYVAKFIDMDVHQLSESELLSEIMAETDIEDIEQTVTEKAIENGFDEQDVHERMKQFTGNGRPFRYQFTNPQIHASAEDIAERYMDHIEQDGLQSFFMNSLIHTMLDDGTLTYDIEVLDDPNDDLDE